ncbi:hypothetical protein ACGK9U_05415 [Mariniflexile sp. HNIBRBA6329]|uniref:hypothetical protein n=1 Tax=Mariniflexile sp. HNIBRBA6329 TaxID=3373088 RepID=UPI0037452F57
MKTLKFIPIFFFLFYNCNAQTKQNSEEKALKPDENIQVNKEYDEFGNLTKYDSIYSYSYSSNGKLSDSIKLKFKNHFSNHSFFNDSFFDDFFKQDSITGHFNPHNFFYDGFINQDEHIKSMMKRMDSIQQQFFNHNFQSIIPAEPQKKEFKKI